MALDVFGQITGAAFELCMDCKQIGSPSQACSSQCRLFKMATLTGLPVEIVSNILSFVDPEDIARTQLACRFLYHTVKDNAAMFRALYLNYLVSGDI